MTRSLTLLLMLALFAGTVATAQEPAGSRYSLVRLAPRGDAQWRALADLGLDHLAGTADGLTGALSADDIAALRTAGVEMTVLVNDLERHYATRSARDLDRINRERPQILEHPSAAVANFRLGTVAGFLNTAEFEEMLTQMSDAYPQLVSTPQSIGLTHEGREILAVRISARPISDESARRALFTAMHHAREPGGMMSLLYTMWALVEGYGTDPEYTWLLDNRVLWFVPLVNPDGWANNVRRFPAGGGMWRKNMRAGGDSAVDLNRNYGPLEYWDHPDGGSSANRQSDTYRGPAPFSEPETRAVRDFVLAENFTVALNHHTFSNLLVQSDAIVTMSPADSAYFRVASPAIARSAGYAPGGDKITVGYQARGTSDDWMFTFGGGDGHLFSWTPESGNADDGFWPVPSRIVPISDWNHRLNLRVAWAAGAAPTVAHTAWSPRADGTVVSVTIANIGRVAMDAPASLWIEGSPEVVEIPVLQPSESLAFELKVPQSLRSAPDPRPVVLVRTRYHEAVITDTVRPLVHAAVTLFEDAFEAGLPRWDAGLSWDTENVPGRGSVASDSPDRNYLATSEVNALSTTTPIDLSGYDGAEIQFDASYAVEARNHDARIEARRAGELEWFPVNSDGLQLPVDHITTYRNRFRADGRTWRTYSARLDDFLGQQIELRFAVEAFPTPFTFDGLLIDNLRVVATPPLSSGVDAGTDRRTRLSAMPNPARDAVSVRLFGSHSAFDAILIDPLGRVAAQAHGASLVTFDTRDLPPGAYTLVLTADGEVLRERVVIAR